MIETIMCPQYSTAQIIVDRSLGVFLALTINDCLHENFNALHHIKKHQEKKKKQKKQWHIPSESSLELS